MRRKLSPALVIATVALFVALGGSAVAAKHYIITSSSQVKNGSLKAVDLSRGARRTLHGARGPAGPAGPQGPAGPVNLSHMTRVEVAGVIAAGDVNSVTATCPAGMGVVTGGYVDLGAGSTVFINDTEGSSNSWVIGSDNFNSSLSDEVHAFAYCVPSNTAVTASNWRAKLQAQLAARRAAHQ